MRIFGVRFYRAHGTGHVWVVCNRFAVNLETFERRW